MTKFEEEIKEAMGLEGLAVFLGKKPLEMDNYAKAAAEVARRYIEKAFLGGYFTEDVTNDDVIAMKHGQTLSEYFKEKWLKENGIV